MENKETKEARKNLVWKYNTVSHELTVVFPSGKEKTFNLANRVNGMAFSDELIFQYGIRQWMSSNAAAIKDEQEKLESFKRDFQDFVEHGLELSDGGTKISVVGRERANRSEKAEERRREKELASKAISMVELTQKLLAGTITDEERAQLANIMATTQALKK